MIALTLLALTGLYVSLFVVAGVRNHSWPRRLFWWAALVAPLVGLTWDIPIGYYRFKAMCETEGGVRIFEEKPAQAKVLRLDAKSFGARSGGGFLIIYPSLTAVEAADEAFGTAAPPAYARYERDPKTPYPNSLKERDEFKPVAHLLDRVELVRNSYVTVERGASMADYVLSEEVSQPPIRLYVHRDSLRRPDGRLVATSTRISYAWADSSVYGSVRVDRCGGPTDGFKPLLALVTQTKVN